MVMKIHLFVGQNVIDSPISITYLTENGDPRESWYATPANALIWDADLSVLGVGGSPFYSPLVSCSYSDGATSPYKGTRCGPDVSAMRDFAALEASDYHCLVKIIGSGAVVAGTTAPSRWDKASADLYTDLVPQVTACRAALAALLPAVPVEIGSITVALGYFEVGNGTAAGLFAAALEQFVTDVRTDLAAITGQSAATIPVMLWQMPQWSRLGDGGPYTDALVSQVRGAAQQLAHTDDWAAVVNIDHVPHTVGRIYASADGAIEAGEAIAEAYQSMVDPDAVLDVDGGLPIVVYVGQSNVAGTTSTIFLGPAFNSDDELIQDYTGKVWTYDWTAETVVPYDADSNSNTGPDPAWNDTGLFGPDVGASPGLLDLHPETGFCWFKLGANASSLGVNTLVKPIWLKKFSGITGAIWPTLEAGWLRCKQQCIEVTGRVPDVRMVIVHQGEGDTEAALYPYYLDHLREFIADLRALFTTNTRSADLLPVGIVKTKEIEGGSYTGTGLTQVRAAQFTAAQDEGNFLVDIDDLPHRSDLVHLSGEGTIRAGRRIVETIPDWYDSGQPVGGA
jgi:hypothetical protein